MMNNYPKSILHQKFPKIKVRVWKDLKKRNNYHFGVCTADFKKSRIPPSAVVPQANNPPRAASLQCTLHCIQYIIFCMKACFAVIIV